MKKNNNQPQKFVYFTSLAFEMLATMLIGGGLGYWIDQTYDHDTLWATLLGFLLGLAVAFYLIFKQLQRNQ